MAAALIQDEVAQEAHNFLVSIMQGTADVNRRGFGARMQAAQAIIRFWQFQERYLSSGPASVPPSDSTPSDLANLSDAELEARVAPIIDFPANRSAG